MVNWLKRIWNGPAVAKVEHPLFGTPELTTIRGKESWDGDSVPFEGRTIAVYVNTSGSQVPTDAQVQFFREVTGNLSAMFQHVASILIPAYEEIYGPLKGPWNDTFEFVGIEIPLDANPGNPWLLQFETPKQRADLFTVYFRNGSPAEVGYDS